MSGRMALQPLLDHDPSRDMNFPPGMLSHPNIFTNDQILGATPRDEILVKKRDWVDFLDGLDDGNEWNMDDPTDDEWSEENIDELDEAVEPDVYFRQPDVDLDGYMKAVEDASEDYDEEYFRIPDDIDYEDPVDKSYLID